MHGNSGFIDPFNLGGCNCCGITSACPSIRGSGSHDPRQRRLASTQVRGCGSMDPVQPRWLWILMNHRCPGLG